MGRRRAVAGLMAVAIAAGLYTGTSRAQLVQATAPAPGTITTIAGASPNSGPATTVSQTPWGVATHGSTLYVGDGVGNVVRAVDINTGQETVAAGVTGPLGLAVDAAGNLYIATRNDVHMRDTSGVISTIATGFSYATGIAADAAGDVFVADLGSNQIKRVDHATRAVSTVAGIGTAAFSGDGKLATLAQLSGPEGVAVDSAGTTLWIADTQNWRIRKVDPTGTINTVAGGASDIGCGNGPASSMIILPIGVWVDASGNVFIADQNHNCIRELTGTTLTTVVGTGKFLYSGDGGPATSATLADPINLTIDGSGDMFIADNYNLRVRKVTAGIITTFAGTGIGQYSNCALNGDGDQATTILLCDPSGVAVDSSGDVFFSEFNEVREVTPAGVLTTIAGGGNSGLGDNGPATAAQLKNPGALAFDTKGDLLIADLANTYYPTTIRMVDTSGVIHTLAGGGSNIPGAGAVPSTSVFLMHPSELAAAPNGDFYIADTFANKVEKVTVATSTIAVVAGGGTNYPGDGGSATLAQLDQPEGVALDSSGNLYISSGQRLQKVDAGGIITTVSVFDPNTYPGSLAFAPTGQLVMSTGTGRLFAITDIGPEPVVGNSSAFSGDGGPAYLAGVYAFAFAFDATGDMFIADGSNANAGRVRRVQAFAAPSAPTSVSAVASIHSATVQWAAPATTGGLPIAQYTVRSFQGATPGPSVNVRGATTAVVGGLAANVPYTFTVSAFNGWVSGPASATSSAVIPTVLTTGGDILTYAGSIGNGPATSLGQFPYSLALAGTHLYVGDLANPVIRDVDLGNGQEGVLAGNDSYGYSGDGGMAASAMIYGAGAMAYCGGQEYFADLFNYVIRRIDSTGRISTFAGTGQFGYSGDGGPATSARFGRVLGLACRTGGGLYVSDSDNRAVRIIDANGTISMWWSGFSFPTGITELGSQNVVAVSDSGVDNAVWRLSATASVLDGTPGVPGTIYDPRGLNDPRGLAFLNGYLYIADRGNNVIRVVDQNGSVSLVGGAFSQPTGLAADGANNFLYVGNIGSFTVVRGTISGSSVSSFASVAGNGTPSLSGNGGPAAQAQLGNPYAVALDSTGDLFIADNQNEVIRKVDPAGTITTIAGNGVAGNAGDGGPALAAKLNDPRGVAVAANGDVYISDAGNSSVRMVDHRTGLISTILSGLSFPRAVAVDAAGSVYIADTGDNRVLVMRFTAGGAGLLAGTGTPGYSGDGGLAAAATLNQPRGLAVDASGNVYIADTGNNRVRRVDHLSGNITTVAGNGTAGLTGDGRAATSAELNFPFGLAVDAAGYLYIADAYNQRIRVVDPRGNIDSVVGTCGGVAGFSGDGGPASNANVNFPLGVAVDAFGDLFIADVNSNRVRGAAGLASLRGTTCQGPIGTAGGRGTNPSGSPIPSKRTVETGGPASKSVNDTVLPGRVSSVPSQPTLVAPKQLPAAQPAPVTKPGATQPNPPVAQKPPAARPAPARGRAPAPTAVLSNGQNSWPRPDSFLWVLLVPVAVLTVAIALARRRSRRMNR